MMHGEFDYIAAIRRRIPSAPHVLVGPGDDCAVLAPSPREQLVTVDAVMDGVDFILNECGPVAAGRKAMLVNLSDLAAMAGEPKSAVIALCCPRSREIADGVFEGIHQVARQYGTAIIGGDTNTWDGPLVISITLLGEVTGRGPVLRSGAKVGDWLIVTGPLGGSLRGRHLEPTPRIREAIDVHASYTLHAMIDLSDGLAQDLGHILEESHCGAELIAERIPIHADARASSGPSPLDRALGDGEDFELLMALPPDDARRLLRDRPAWSHIGQCVEQGMWLIRDGRRETLPPRGWEHELTSDPNLSKPC